jgi:hypothetical protein
MFRTIRSKETSQIAMVTGSEPNKKKITCRMKEAKLVYISGI